MQEPLVSVLMITYNHRAHLAKAIDHVLAQKTSFPFELVIGEDCSTDGAREIAFDYAARHPKVIRLITSERNVGMIANLDRANGACRGKYIAYCEGDDFWQRPDKLQLQADYLENHPECGLVSSDYDEFDTQTLKSIANLRKSTGRPTVQSPNISDILAGFGHILTCTVLARRELLDQIRAADPHLHLSGHFKMGDTQLWAELAQQAKIFVMDESLATRQLLAESATQSVNPIKRLRFWASHFEMCSYLCEKHKLSASLRQRHKNNWANKSLQLALLTRDRDLAERVRAASPNLSLKNHLWYLGAKHPTMRPIVMLLHRYAESP
jgi:glycosyltransferase involved in cell wall biosynthesis